MPESTTVSPTATKKAAKKVARKPRKPKEPPKFLVEISIEQLAAIENVVNGVDELLYSMGVMPSTFGPRPSKPTPAQKMMADATDFINDALSAQEKQEDLKNGYIGRCVEEQRKEALDAINQVLKPSKKLDNDADKQAALEHAKHNLERISELLNEG